MHPVPFEYLTAASVDEALHLMKEYGEDLKILAGGQSLVPAMNLRLARPTHVLDISRIPELKGVRLEGDRLSVGALFRHADVVKSAEIRRAAPLLCEGAALIGNVRVRHKGTIGGSLAHADPAAELGACAVALRAEIEVVGPEGVRTIPAEQFFLSVMTTALAPDEIITRVLFPVAGPGTGACFNEVVRRAGDFAIVGVGAQVTLASDLSTIQSVGVGLIGLGDTPIRAGALEESLLGQAATEEALRKASELALEGAEPAEDVFASADYRRAITPAIVRRTLEIAVRRARENGCSEGR